jgi:divalent metal cation (Fe/Co/Zn/Cd) transporter
VAILGVLRSAVREVLGRLMDAVDPALVDRAEDVLAHAPGVRAVRTVKIRWIGHVLHAEADLDVDPGLSLAEAHEVAHHAEAHLVHAVPRLTGATIHTIHTSPAGDHLPAVAPAAP